MQKVSDLTGFASQAWAKRTPDGAVLALADHGTDVAAVLAALLEAGWAERIGKITGRALTSGEVERLCAFAYLHDMGKANAGFWLRQFPGRAPAGHTSIALMRPVLSRVVDLLRCPSGEALLLATLAHHGQPVCEPRANDLVHWDPLPSLHYDPLRELDMLIAQARQRYGAAFAATSRPLSNAAIALFAGLLTLADWLGSDPVNFSMDGVTGEERAARSARTARDLVQTRGLGRAPWAATAPRDFAGVFPGLPPREAQAKAAESAARLGTLIILEAETGSGKTEAALWRFVSLFREGVVDGLYFALPTRTSATQMWKRVRDALDAAFGEGVIAPVQAVPGYLRAGHEEGVRTGRFDVLWPDVPRDGVEDARWAAEAPKQYLAARVAVGTIDQALMAGLKLRHAHLRAACLSRSLLVIDEVHASDEYMSMVLAGVLENHRAAGGHAMLLSATLGASARTRLLDGANATPPPLREAIGVPYPALHGAGGASPVSTDGRDKSIHIALAGALDDPGQVAALALDAADAGARVLVIRNTVAGALAVQAALEARGNPEPLFNVNGVLAPHHGRFAPQDRRLLDEAIEAAFGKTRPTGAGLVAVGTQTLEISLDLDSDLMITDLAPMDVMLQRLGRLHRHATRARPPVAHAPRAIVLTPPQRDLSPFLGRVAERHGLGPVDGADEGIYPNLAAIEATWRLLSERGTLSVPRDNRELVERTTHPEAMQAIAEELGWQDFMQKREGGLMYDRQLARGHALKLSQPFDQDLMFPEADEAVRTRLGEDGVRVDFAAPVAGPFGTNVDTVTVPGWMARGIALDAPLPELEPTDGGFCFIISDKRFAYDRWGLRRRDR